MGYAHDTSLYQLGLLVQDRDRETLLFKKALTAFFLNVWMALYPLESQNTLMQLEGPEVAVVAEHPGQPQLQWLVDKYPAEATTISVCRQKAKGLF